MANAEKALSRNHTADFLKGIVAIFIVITHLIWLAAWLVDFPALFWSSA